jgi:ssDNA-binding Zn-finger/Zn-ribbon topoisomerase 1
MRVKESAQIEDDVLRMRRELSSVDQASLLQKKRQLDLERQPLLDELGHVNRDLADIESSVIREASIIGATVTKVYLSVKDLPNFDTVIIDEASMVLLPALYYASGLATDRVIISGDFRQLPPICPTDQQEILAEIGSSVFHAARIVEIFETGGQDARLVMLDEQYRMDDEICRLISQPMYKGKLRTSSDREPYANIQSHEFLADTLTIVDTSQLWPFETQTPFGSRYNLIHSLVVRSLFSELRKVGFVQDGDTDALGICTPYAAQAKLIKRLIADERLELTIDAGTVHRYQGDQKRMMIVDIPESVGGGYYVGRFLQGDHPDDDGAKLLNVAVSRAKQHLVFVANLTYLDQHLPGNAVLRDFLFQIQTRGRVLDASEILTLQPADLRGLAEALEVDLDGQQGGLFQQNDFDALFRADVEQAQESVVIFSGFITPDRVASYGDLFRKKVLQGVSIRCVTRPPHRNGSLPPEMGKEALDHLEGIGVIVDCRRDTHEKLIVVDKSIVWIGSLNALSHTARTDEIMIRSQSPQFAVEIIKQTSVRALARRGETIESNAVAAENPRCTDCGGRTFYLKSKKNGRRYFVCETGCKWIRDVDQSPIQPSLEASDGTVGGQPCSLCGAETIRRMGPHGLFFSCVRYPHCKGKPRTKERSSKTTRVDRETMD